MESFDFFTVSSFEIHMGLVHYFRTMVQYPQRGRVKWPKKQLLHLCMQMIIWTFDERSDAGKTFVFFGVCPGLADMAQ